LLPTLLSRVHPVTSHGRSALAYVLLTFGFSWTAWFAAARLAGGRLDDQLLSLGGPVFLLGVFAPALVAVAMTWRANGRQGVAQLLAQIGRWRVGTRWYAFAFTYFIAIKLTAALLQRVVTGDWPAFGTTSVLLMAGAILVSTWTQAGEEVGWRGYLLPALADRMSLGAASISLGLIWALWHMPLFYIDGSGSAGQSFPLYASHVTALSVAMAWLYWRTGQSLLLVMVMHAAVNNTTGGVVSAVPGASDVWTFSGSLVAWGTVGLSWLVAAAMLKDMRGAKLASAETDSPAGDRG
jgi:uncharacterized protein